MSDRDQSAFVGHAPCEACGSRDNKSVYASGRTHCHGCGHNHFPEDMKRSSSPKEPRRVTDYSIIPPVDLKPADADKLHKGYGLAQDTMRRLGITTISYSVKVPGEAPGDDPVRLPKKTCLAFTYRFADGAPFGQKVRYPRPFPDKEKTFAFPNAGGTPPLWLMHMWNSPTLKSLVVFEGEGDAGAYFQVTKGNYPVVSIPTGANGTETIFKDEENLAFLRKAEDVVLIFDGDEAGRQRVQEAASLLSDLGIPVRIGEVQGYKDARSALLAGQGGAVTDAFFKARAFQPEGLVEIEDLFDAAEAPAEWGLPWPWPGMTQATYGIRRHESYYFGGGVGCGKTEVFKELILNVIDNWKLKAGVIFLEEQPKKTAKVLAGKLANKRFHLPNTPVEPGEIRGWLEKLRGKVTILNHFGRKDWEALKPKIRHMVVVQGIKDVFIDHLTALAAGKDASVKEAYLDKVASEVAEFVEGLGATAYVISHLTTPKFGKPHEEGGRVYENQFTGSRAIARWAHNMFGIERNKQNPGSPTSIRILKERESGDAVGFRLGLHWNAQTGRYEECEAPPEEAEGFQSDRKAASGFRDQTVRAADMTFEIPDETPEGDGGGLDI